MPRKQVLLRPGPSQAKDADPEWRHSQCVANREADDRSTHAASAVRHQHCTLTWSRAAGSVCTCCEEETGKHRVALPVCELGEVVFRPHKVLNDIFGACFLGGETAVSGFSSDCCHALIRSRLRRRPALQRSSPLIGQTVFIAASPECDTLTPASTHPASSSPGEAANQISSQPARQAAVTLVFYRLPAELALFFPQRSQD